MKCFRFARFNPSCSVWASYGFALSLRDVEGLPSKWGAIVSSEINWVWRQRFETQIAAATRPRDRPTAQQTQDAPDEVPDAPEIPQQVALPTG